MVARINYEDIKNMKPYEAYELISNVPCYKVSEAKVKDLVNQELLDSPLHEFTDNGFSSRGLYFFFNAEKNAIYIGQTNTQYLARLTTQLDTTFYPGWGWNSLLRILGGIRTGKPHDELSYEDHEIDLEQLLECQLLLIEVNRSNDVDSTKLKRLERTMQKLFKEVEDNVLLNGNTGELKPHEWEMVINNIIQ